MCAVISVVLFSFYGVDFFYFLFQNVVPWFILIGLGPQFPWVSFPFQLCSGFVGS